MGDIVRVDFVKFILLYFFKVYYWFLTSKPIQVFPSCIYIYNILAVY